MSVRSPTIRVPYTEYIPPIEEEDEHTTSRNPSKRKRGISAVRRREPQPEPVYDPRPFAAVELQWYASEPLEHVEASLGLLALSGTTTEALEQRVQRFRIRSQYITSCIA